MSEQGEVYYVGEERPDTGDRVRVMSVGRCHYATLMNSLGQFRAEGEGEASWRGNRLTLKNAKLRVQDRYDWTASKEFGAGVKMFQVLDELGIGDLFGNKVFDDFKSLEFEILDEDGVLLVEEGLADNFEIVADLGVVDRLELGEFSGVEPPESYVKEKGAVVVGGN